MLYDVIAISPSCVYRTAVFNVFFVARRNGVLFRVSLLFVALPEMTVRTWLMLAVGRDISTGQSELVQDFIRRYATRRSGLSSLLVCLVSSDS